MEAYFYGSEAELEANIEDGLAVEFYFTLNDLVSSTAADEGETVCRLTIEVAEEGELATEHTLV